MVKVVLLIGAILGTVISLSLPAPAARPGALSFLEPGARPR
jgi:hypothetical protein